MKRKLKTISKIDAYKMYLKLEYDTVMPFDNSLEETFLRYIEKLGYTVYK